MSDSDEARRQLIAEGRRKFMELKQKDWKPSPAPSTAEAARLNNGSGISQPPPPAQPAADFRRPAFQPTTPKPSFDSNAYSLPSRLDFGQSQLSAGPMAAPARYTLPRVNTVESSRRDRHHRQLKDK
eukprot:TRINITY_DN10237_c0_g3_i2.p1 TRINITY_DN10237_c0_g3~~TRINITY_DN10237_c0_g3_i2.p1  ORF type:complete len:127 (+),score=11.66 TRINITY_DN10237_c0_g3_i2:191-571(+)